MNSEGVGPHPNITPIAEPAFASDDDGNVHALHRFLVQARSRRVARGIVKLVVPDMNHIELTPKGEGLFEAMAAEPAGHISDFEGVGDS